MPKKHKIKAVDIERSVMTKIESNQVAMKPRWYFIAGSLFSIIGLVSSGILATFLINLTIFLLRSHGPNAQWRLQLILASFPLWIPILAIGGILLGIWLLKKYDFSYQKNFKLIIFTFILSILMTAFLLDYTGLNDTWMSRGPMRRFREQNQRLNFINSYQRQ